MTASKVIRQFYHYLYVVNSLFSFKIRSSSSSPSPSDDDESISDLKVSFVSTEAAGDVEQGIKTPRPVNKNQETTTTTTKKPTNWPLLLLSCTFVAIGVIGGPLLSRLYYLHGGNRQWITSCMETAGFPILFIPLFSLFLQSRSQRASFSDFFMEPKLFILSAFIGLLLGLDNFLYSIGLSYTPVSTSSILFATQLAFLAVFAFFIVKQKFTAYSINSVFLMTLGSVLLGLRTDGDRPAGVTNGQYLLGFFLTLASAAVLGLIWPLVELSYSKAKRPVNYSIVLQFQLNIAIFATIFSATGMFLNNDFQAISKEASEYGLGSNMYYTVLAAGAIVWQLSFLGGVGVVFCANSLLNGILSAVLLPITEVAAVIAYRENFNGEKALALVLCLWGFTSYFYGEYKMNKKLKNAAKKQVAVQDEPTRTTTNYVICDTAHDSHSASQRKAELVRRNSIRYVTDRGQ